MVAASPVVIDMTFPPDSATPRHARAAVAQRFGDHPRCADILVCVSEAVTNAVLHAGTRLRLVIRLSRDGLRVEVSDTDPSLPVRRNPDPTTPTGRGLLLIDKLTDRWGVETSDAGKTLWFEVPS